MSVAGDVSVSQETVRWRLSRVRLHEMIRSPVEHSSGQLAV
jgi:hypothetical protein